LVALMFSHFVNLGNRVDFAQLIKTCAATQETARYSPAKIIKTERLPIFGNPNPNLICTSHVERLNLTYRLSLRRFTRLTNAHSKSLKLHVAAQAIFVAFSASMKR
jgi:IS1 family transposase